MKKQNIQKQTTRRQEYLTEEFLNDGRGIYERQLDFAEYEGDIIRSYREKVSAWNY